MRLEKKRKLDAAKRLELRNKNTEASMVDPEVDQQMKEEMLKQLNFFRDNILKGIVGGIVTETKRSGPVFEKHLEKNSDLIKEVIEGIKEGMDDEIRELIESNTDAVREAIDNFTAEVTDKLSAKEDKTKKSTSKIDQALLDIFKRNTDETEKTTVNTEEISKLLESIKESSTEESSKSVEQISKLLESIKQSSNEKFSKSVEQISSALESIKESSTEESSKSVKQLSKILESISQSSEKTSSDVKNEVQFRTESEKLSAEIIKILETSTDKQVDSKKLLESLNLSIEKIVKSTKESVDLQKESKESKEKVEDDERPARRPTSRERDDSYEAEGPSTDEKIDKILRSREAEATEEPEMTGKQKTVRFLKRVGFGMFGEQAVSEMESRENKKLQYVQAQKQLRPEMSEKDLEKEYKNIEQQKEELARADRKYQQLKESGNLTPEELEKTDIAKERKMYADFIMPDRGEVQKTPREERAAAPRREKPIDLFKASSEEKSVEDERARTQALKEEVEQGDSLSGLVEESKKHTEILTSIKGLLEKGGAGGAAAEGEGGGLIDTALSLGGRAKAALKKGASTAAGGLRALASNAKFMKFAKVGGAALALGAGAYTAYKGYGEASEESETKLADIDRAERQGAITPEEAAQQREATRAETTEKKSSAVGKGAGMAAGALGGAKVGAMIGTAFGGPVGTLVGGAIGGGIGMLAGTKLGESAGRVVGKGISGLKSMLGLYKDEKPMVEDSFQKSSEEQRALKESTEIKFSEETFAKNDSENYKKFVEFRESRLEELTKKYEEEAKTANQKAYAPEKARIIAQAEAIKKFRKEIEASGAGEVVKEAGKKPLEKTGSGEFTPEKQAKEAEKSSTLKSEAVGRGTGLLAGLAGGAKVGAGIGSVLGGPVGTAAGAVVGGISGAIAGTKVGSAIGGLVDKGVSGLKKMFGSTTEETKTSSSKLTSSSSYNKEELVRTEAVKLGIDPNAAEGKFEAGVLTSITDTTTGKNYKVEVSSKDKSIVESTRNLKETMERSITTEPSDIKGAKVEPSVPASISRAPIDQTSVAAAKAAAKNISIQQPAPVVISQPSQPQQVVPEPFVNNIRNSENSISKYIGSRYLAA